jgi:hypothetical protein
LSIKTIRPRYCVHPLYDPPHISERASALKPRPRLTMPHRFHASSEPPHPPLTGPPVLTDAHSKGRATRHVTRSHYACTSQQLLSSSRVAAGPSPQQARPSGPSAGPDALALAHSAHPKGSMTVNGACNPAPFAAEVGHQIHSAAIPPTVRSAVAPACLLGRDHRHMPWWSVSHPAG